MTLLLAGIGSYLLTAFVHVLLHRALAFGFGKRTKTVFGFLSRVVATAWFLNALPPQDILLSALLLYLLLSVVHFFVFYELLFDARSPSAKLLFLIRHHGPLTRDAILTHFSDEETVVNRVNTLVYEGYLVERGSRFYAADKAMPIARFMSWYRRLMKWERGG